MAAVNCYSVALFKNLRKSPVAISSASTTSVSSSFGRRRNHLRPKILKTLTKPSVPTPPPPSIEPLERTESRQEDVMTRDVEEEEVVMEEDGGGSEGVECDVDALKSEIGGSEMAVFDNRFVGKLDMKIVGMYGLGLVVQAVCAVFIFGSAGVSRDDKDGEFESGSSGNTKKQRLALEDDVRIRRIVAKASKAVDVDEAVLEERIAEIRAMARNAREREAKEGRRESDDDVDGIEKEVSTRLVRLQKKLGSVQDKPPLSLVDSVTRVQKGSASSDDVNGKLVFSRKQTFRNSIPTKPLNDAKGFSNVTDHTDNLVVKQEAGIDPVNSTNLISLPSSNGNSPINDASTTKENGDKKLLRMKALELKRRRANQKTEATKFDTETGDVQGVSYGKPVGTSNTSTVKGASQLEVVNHDKNDALSLNVCSQNQDRKATVSKGSDNEAASWWLHLPYVFAILMHEGSGPRGLYTLKAPAKACEKQVEAYTVAFEDRGDANNFCYIVESFFEDMRDFATDILPLPTKEMLEPVESGVLNVIIVKKGQLELYAGQPLGEVETRLRSLVL